MAKKKKKAGPETTEEVEGDGSPGRATTAAKEKKANKKGGKGKKVDKPNRERRKGGGTQEAAGGGDGDEGYESPDIAEGLDELEELAGLDIDEDPATPIDALDDLAALEIPDDSDDEAVTATAGASSKQDRKAAEKLAKQEAKEEAERENQRRKQEAKAAAKLAKQEAKAEQVKAAEDAAAAEVAAAEQAAIAELRDKHGIKEGHPVEYKSTTASAWVPAKLVEIRADGSLYVDLGNGRVNERCDPERVRPALFRAKPKVLEAHLKNAKRREKLESQAGAAVAAAEAERLQAVKSLLLRSCHNGDLKSMRSALRDGAHVNCRDTNLWTPLMCAARHGDVRCVRALIGSAANVNSSSRGGATALHMAASNGRVDVILLLLKAGADLSATTDSGMRPRQLAERRGMLEAVAAIDIFQEGGGLTNMQVSISSLAQREALRDVVTQAKVRRREIASYEISIKRQKGEQLLKSFRNQIGPLHRQDKAQQDFLATRGEAHAQQVEARFCSEHIADPSGLIAGRCYLDLLAVHRLPQDKLDVATKNILLFRKLFDMLDTRQQGWLPRYVVYEFLQTMDPEWDPFGGRQQNGYSEDQEAHWMTTFHTMLRLYIVSKVSVAVVETALLKDYSEPAALVADIAALIKIGEADRGRGLIDYHEWSHTLLPAIASHTKKPHLMKPKESLEIWRFLSKVADDDPRITRYKHGGFDVSGMEHTQPTEPGHVDTATLLASVRPPANGEPRAGKSLKLYKKFINGVLVPSALAHDELFGKLVAEQEKIVEGVWLRANRRVIIRAEVQPNSTEVAILLPGETIQVLSVVNIVDTTMLRIRCVRGWVSHISAIDDAVAFDRVDVDDGKNSSSFDLEEIPTTDEEEDGIQPLNPDQSSILDEKQMNERPGASDNQVELLAGMLCVALVSLRARRNAGPKSRQVAGGSVPAGQAFHILSVSQTFPGFVLCYCGWVQILVDGKRPFVRFLDNTVEAAQVFVIGGAGRISDVGPLGITFIEAPNPHWIPGSNEPKFCTTFHSVGRGSPAAKACKEMARGACYGWVLETVEGVSVTRMTFDDVLSLIQNTTKRPMKLSLRPPCFLSVPLKPLLNEDGTDVADSELATEGQDEQGLGGCFFNSLMHGFYRTVRETTLRTGYQVSTRIAGVLAAGTFVEVIESRVNSMGHTRMLCIGLGGDDSDEGKGIQGWASLYARDGHRLLREQTAQEKRDRDHMEHNAFLIEERSSQREQTKAATDLQARKMAGQNSLEIRMCSAAASGDAGWVLEQLRQGATADCLDSSGCTPLMRAAENGHAEVLKALLQYGVDHQKHLLLNEVGEAGTALSMATTNGHHIVAATLLRYRADPLIADENGIRPIDIARKSQNDKLLRMLQEATNDAKIDLSRAHAKESVRLAAMQTFTPQIMRQVAEACDDLHAAVFSGNVNRTIKAIGTLQSLDSTNGINRPDKEGNVPLAKAAAGGKCAVISLLLAHNATVDTRSARGETALSIACLYGQVAAAGLLLRAGADPSHALNSLSAELRSVRLANPRQSSNQEGMVVDREIAGVAGCQLLVHNAFLARNVVQSSKTVGRKPSGVSPINVDAWTGGGIPSNGMRVKLNGVPSPTVPQINAAAVALNGQAAVNGHAANTGATQQPPTDSRSTKKRGLRRRAPPVAEHPHSTSADQTVAAEVTEQTENPLAASYANTGLASPIADGQTFDVEDASPAPRKARGIKWTGGLKRQRKEAARPDDGQQSGGLVVTEESPLPPNGTSTVGQSSELDGADELAAIEIPTDDDFGGDSTTESIGDLL